MGNSLMCCLSCMLPCGALDLIRIVHLNGHVEEITHPVTAHDVLINYPNHVLTKSSSHGVVRRILIISDGTKLNRGNIYFLVPLSSIPESTRKHHQKLKPVMAPTITNDISSPSSHVRVVSTKSCRPRKARRTIQTRDWKPILESIFEE
ncbi:hypothetical protein CTI12_AA467720 [Artemisia annua]|uniref:Uncharacterized protein n=1 Tax=Artemisia annua TaxID=35608 RepID=A0A2U1LPU7_ARTAN|nr:hypothetical protein CTI12_AA467720 [Artemisia annua]